MPYIGNPAVVGDSSNTFRLLDDIASFTVTFDATDSGVVSIANNTLTFNNHRFVTGQKVTYNDGGGTAIGGLSDGSYFIIKEDQSTIKLASSASNATAGTAIDLTSGAAGGSHTLNIAQDGVNTKFKATHSNGRKAKVSRPAQITLSINGVIQAPNDGYSIESDSTIVFSQAPEATDKIFASFIGEVAASFDIADNTVDEFTANGSTTTFTLSKTVPSSNDLLVTLDGVTQYPNTQSATRAYSVLENVLTFTSAPAAGVIIQARHIGFAGASSQTITGFYGRTGNVQLKSTDDVAVNDVTASGNLTAVDGAFSGNVTIGGTLGIGGTLTYEDVTNVDAVGLITARDGIVVGSGITLSVDGDGFYTGVVTATTFSGAFSGDGSALTGVANTDVIFPDKISFGDGDGVNLGVSSDLRIYHNGSHSFIQEEGTGSLYIDSNQFYLRQADTDTVLLQTISNGEVRINHNGNEKIRTESSGVTVTGTVAATSYTGDGSSLTGISVGIATTASQVSGITTVIDLDKDDIRLDCTGLVTIDTKGGTEGGNHILRIVNVGIATVSFSSYFKFPSGAPTPLPTASGAISLVSFTVHTQGRVGVASVFLTGSSINYS